MESKERVSGRRRSRSIIILLLSPILLLTLVHLTLNRAAPLAQGDAIVERVSLASDGTQAQDSSDDPAISPNGRYVAFRSYAENLVSGDTNGEQDVFLHDRQTGQTRRVSVASDGTQGDRNSGEYDRPAVSDDGRYVAFASLAENLVSGDTNMHTDVFVHDVQTGVTILLSKATDGSQGDGDSEGPAMSADGRYVAFASHAALVAADDNDAWDVYVHDRDPDGDGVFDEPGAFGIVRVSVASDGSQGNNSSSSGFSRIDLSPDGRFVAFDSFASNLVISDTNGWRDVFVHDRDVDGDGAFDEAGGISTVRVSVAGDGTQANGEASQAAISNDGRYVAFSSWADSLDASDTVTCAGDTTCADVFLHDRDVDGDGVFDEPGQISTRLVSVATDGSPGDSHSYFPDLSADGRIVTFHSTAGNLVPGDGVSTDVFAHDTQTGETELVSVTYRDQAGDSASLSPAISADGRYVAFRSSATNLVPGDTNYRSDVFVHDRQGVVPVPTPTWTPTPTPTATPVPTVESPGGKAWRTQALAVRGNVGQFADMVLDSQGQPHISYYYDEGFQGELRYARWDGLNWRVQTVDAGDSTFVATRTSIALGSDDRPHISYYSSSDRALKYARWTGSAWAIETVASGGQVGHYPSLALVGGVPYISYYDAADGELLVSQWQVNWRPHLVEEGAGLESDLAVDDHGVLHISFYNMDDGDLKYGTWNGVTWEVELVDGGGDVGRYSSLTFDSQNRPHVSYFDATNGALKYATHDGMGWTTRTVPGAGGVEGHTSLALDGNDTPYISYYGNSLHLAVFKESWQIETVDPDAGAGLYNRVALDSDGMPRLAYYDSSFRDLKYGVWGPAWQLREVEAAGSNVQQPALALQNGRPAISYHRSVFNLMYTQGLAGTWRATLLGINSVPPSALALGPNGWPRVADYNVAFAFLYRAWDGSGWGLETAVQLPQFTTVGQTLDLVLLGGTEAIVYVQELGVYPDTSQQVRLAQRVDGAWQVFPNTAGPALAQIGQTSAGVLIDGRVAVSYFDQDDGALRVATWDGGSWSDELVDAGDGAEVGRYNALAAGREAVGAGVRPVIAVAYYDAAGQAIKYAHNAFGGWSVVELVPGVGDINSLDLDLAAASRMLPYIAYGAQDEAAIKLAFSDDNLATLTVETVADGVGPAAPSQVALVHDNQPRIAYRSGGGGLIYGVPTSHDALPAAVHHDGGGVVGVVYGFDGQYCLCISLEDCLGPATAVDLSASTNATARQAGPAPSLADAALPLGDGEVMRYMDGLFSQTTEGQAWVDRYNQHAAEMTQIGLSDPALLWDGYRTLQNFMPGLEALVAGRGAEVVVTQAQVDDALDIWERVAAQAGPELAGAINAELARFDNLQDFVGMTFDEWATAIGVDASSAGVRWNYLPVVLK